MGGEHGLQGPGFGPAAGGTANLLAVLCHGVGADGNDLIDLAPLFAEVLPQARFLSPHAPFPYDMAPMGRQWFSLADRSPAALESGVREAARRLDRFLDEQLAALGLASDALVLIGFSQGAMTALFTGLRRAAAPRAILAYSGALIAPERFAAERANMAPVLLVHGAEDPVVPVAMSRAAADLLTAACVPTECVISPGLGHGIDEQGLAAGARFLAQHAAHDR